MADSFYGGRPGFSFIIVANYADVDEMVECFQQGPNYTAVHFDEHVLINTENKNNPNNGKIYRRGYDYTNDMGGAIYVGTIVGPAGKAPMLELTTVEDVKEKQASEGYDYRYGEGSYAPFDNLVPGKDSDGNYNDEIQWAYCSIRNENNEDCTAYIGFIFPYLVVDYEADSVSPYYNRSNDTEDFTNENLVDRMDEGEHPYWEKWHISVPKGLKGDTLNNFRVIVASDDDNVEPYDGQDDDRANGREILVYDYYHYDKEEGGEPVTLYLGDYNMITGITIDDDGTITIEYSHDDTLEYPNLFKWIKEITLDTSNGHLTIIYNYDEEPDGTPTIYETDLAWVSDVTLADDGKITIHYITGDSYILDEHLKWIDNITLDEDGTISIYYNDGTNLIFDKKIKWITSVTLSDEGDFNIGFNNGDDAYETSLVWVKDVEVSQDGTITIDYNNGTTNTYANVLEWITNVSLSDDGEFRVSFNNGTEDYVTNLQWVYDIVVADDGSITVEYNNGEVVEHDKLLKVISDISIETADESEEEGTGDQKVHVTYNTGETDIIGKPLNYIMEMHLFDSDYHLLVWYSDPAKRQEIIDSGQSYTYDGKDGWFDLGAVKDASGILIGLNISLADYPALEEIDAAIEYLNAVYPEGLNESVDLQGKIVTIGDDEANKMFYAFNYNKSNGEYIGWYYLGSLGTDIDMTNIHMVAEDDVAGEIESASLLPGGLWFVVED